MAIQGYAAFKARKALTPYSYEPGDLGPFDVEIAITHCGICRSDVHLGSGRCAGHLEIETKSTQNQTVIILPFLTRSGYNRLCI